MADDGGPAFPTDPTRDEYGFIIAPQSQGMTLRDWFAGQALAGLMASYPDRPESMTADTAYLVAKAMMAEREKN